MAGNVIDVIKEWQTLIAGVIALLAAWWTINQIREQIELQKQHLSIDEGRHADVSRRKAQRARAFLPDALSDISGYTAECMKYLSDEVNTIPPRPETSIGAIKEAIEYVDGESAEKLIELVNFYQIHNSRLSHFKAAEQAHLKTDRMYDVVKLRWLSDRMFGYARNRPAEGQDLQEEREAMTSALRSCVGIDRYFNDEQLWAPIRQMIEQHHPKKE